MKNEQLTFNDLPQVIAELRDEVSGMKALLLNLQNRPTQQRENRHRPVTPEQVAEYTNIPLRPSIRNSRTGKSPAPSQASDGSSTLMR